MTADDAIHENGRLLDEGAALLERVDGGAFASDEPGRPQSSVGCQLRHCIDFYGSFLSGLPARRVDFEDRARDPRVAADRDVAAGVLRRLAAELRALPPLDPRLVLEVRGETGEWCLSTLGRELQFLVSHTVHHFALVALMLRARGIEPGPDFGVAGSTLRHWAAVGS